MLNEAITESVLYSRLTVDAVMHLRVRHYLHKITISNNTAIAVIV